MLFSASDKGKLFAKTFSRNSNIDDLGNSLPVFPSRTNHRLHNITVIPTLLKKIITNFTFPKASGPNCIPVVLLKNCEPKLPHILAKLFNMCLKESFFPDFCKVSSMVLLFENLGGEMCEAKNYYHVILILWLVKSLKNL